MSRQSKMSNKRRTQVKHAKGSGGSAKTVSTGERGPKSTTPKHGKVSRWSYVASQRGKRAS